MYFPRSSLVSTNGWMLERSSKSSRESDTLRRVEGGSQVMRSYRSPSGVKITSLVRWNSPPRRPSRSYSWMRTNYTYTQLVRIQEYDLDGRRGGEFHRTSEVIFTPEGKRYERITWEPPSSRHRVSLPSPQRRRVC